MIAAAHALLARCRELGFARAGIAEARPSSHSEAYRAWIAAGKHGPMQYLAEKVDERLDPAALVPGARSVLCVADRYADGRPDARVAGIGRIARYARGEDYHVVIRARLESLAEELRRVHPEHRFRVCVDTAPLLEREHAMRAGIGRVGKHTLVIAPDGVGSWIALGAIVTTLPLAPVAAGDTPASPDPCGGCTRCIDACPTQAIAPWSVDARRCLSTRTIEDDGALQPGFAVATADWVFGCDICQEVCPHAQPTVRSRRLGVHEAYRPHRTGFPLLELLGWDDAQWEAARLTGVLRRATPAMWRRNAAMAAASALRDADLASDVRRGLLDRLHALASDADQPADVRAAARETLAAVTER